MHNWYCFATLLMGSALSCAADPLPPISGPAEVKRDEIATLIINLPDDEYTKTTVLRLSVKPDGLKVVKSDDGKKWYAAGKPAAYKIAGEVWTRKFDKDGRIQDIYPSVIDYDLRVVGAPDPEPPTPPGPNPPNPPGPTPGPAPIAIDGLSVIFLIDGMALNMTREQLLTIDGVELNNYLKANCPKDKTGQPAWRVYQKGQSLAADEDKAFTDAYAKVADKDTPWVVVSNPKKGGGASVALPKTKAEILALIKQYGG